MGAKKSLWDRISEVNACSGFPRRCVVCKWPADENVCYHDGGYENRKHAWFCTKHANAIRAGELVTR